MDTLHPDLSALTFLLGTWEGEGRGIYPTVEDFTYWERVSFLVPPGKPFIAYRQETRRTGEHPEAGVPLHTESGYLRPAGPDRAELVVAQPTGIVEVHHGAITGTSLAFAAATVATTDTAKEVVSVERNLVVNGDDLEYELLLGAVGQAHQLHLEAVLRRVA
jgi:hypothetical protein